MSITEFWIGSSVKVTSKFLTSKLPDISGIKGGVIFLRSTKSKSIFKKKGCDLISLMPLIAPNLSEGFLINNYD